MSEKAQIITQEKCIIRDYCKRHGIDIVTHAILLMFLSKGVSPLDFKGFSCKDCYIDKDLCSEYIKGNPDVEAFVERRFEMAGQMADVLERYLYG
jgi:hypothetical protein